MHPFCPECQANIGIGTFESIGCPVCGAEPDPPEDDTEEEASSDTDAEEPADD